MDALSIVTDEVALEGLDGITIFSLWKRLEDRKPKFPLTLDECTKEFIWKSLVSNSDLTFYELPQEREDVVLFDRYKDIDPDTGIETTQAFSDARKDIYPVQVILENKDGIQGSCSLFSERKDITKHVRSKSLTVLVSLEEALERYGRKLVVVASQSLRFRALIGNESDPDLKLSDDSYCLLERVGRARWQGELQSDLHGCSFKTDARKLHYIRKSLVKHGLISMQSHVTRLKSGQQQQHSILLQLKRFHIFRRSKYDILMESVSNILKELPGHLSTLASLKEQLNVNDCTFKRLLNYMRSAKLLQFCQYPLEDLDPTAGPCINRNGRKVRVRCLKLLKQYTRKGVADDDDDDDDDDDEDNGTRGRTAFPSEGRIMEKDVLSQAYHLVLSCGTKGIPRTGIGFRMNIGKLESRMICRTLEREELIKGFMEDEGRQRTTKYIGHKCVGVSDHLQLFAKEQERNKLLYSSAAQASDAAPATPKSASTSKSAARKNTKKSAAKKKSGREEDKDAEEVPQMCNADDDGLDGKGEQAPGEEEKVSDSVPADPLPQSEALNADENPVDNNIVVVKDVDQLEIPSVQTSKKSLERSHETYRLLRRKNLIVEAVRNFKIIEGLFQLQKMINDEEKQDGISSKCCRKTILRLVNSLSRQGLLKIFTTTVIVDGITKKVEMVAHPSVQRNDELVNRVIEQVRFRISSSYSAVRLQQAEEKAREQAKDSEEMSTGSPKAQKSKTDKKRANPKDDEKFKPTTVKGLGKTFGFQPKMYRLRVVHTFLYYLIYDHPLRDNNTDSGSTSETPADLHSSDPDTKHPHTHGKQDPKDTQSSENAASGSVEQQTVNATLSNVDVTSGDEGEGQKEKLTPGHTQTDMKAYTDEESWKKFIPPVRVHKEYGSGWAMVGDLVLCLPLSIFVQVIQVNYKVDELEEYLSDPVKQHYLVSALPSRMRRQLLFKRKYLFLFHENLQKLVYMGLLQFGPVEKFKEKDQVFLYLKRKATIVDTTNAEPHYWLVTESPDKPFERRQYTFNTTEDVEKYWFDLMCVCLNTPLGVIRSKRNVTEEETEPSFVHERNVFVGLAYLGSAEVCDDGSIPGDGKGAAGLHSEFFAHLKRNWLWTNHLLYFGLMCFNALCDQVAVESASRNERVVGGKRQKRKRSKKEVTKVQRKKKKEPKKRTPAHDEADHKALKMMTRQRVYWSIQEDSLMMLCCAASYLLNRKLKRPFVPHCVVRDLLHAEFEISVDKTSLSVGRRSRHILKNPQTLLNYRICLAEVYQDKSLMRILEEKKPADPNKPEVVLSLCAPHYFVSVSLKFFKSDYLLYVMVELNCLFVCDNCSADDIHAIVLHNLIQSTLAMTNSQMKSSRSFQTFHMYSKYNQEVLCQVFIECRKRGLVNRRRVCQPFGPKKNRALPILPMSYQLSQSYYRCFSWRFPHSLCTDSFQFLRNLINNGTRDDRSVTAFYHETENRSVSLDSPGGACLVCLSLMSLGLLSVYISIPRQMVVVDSNLVDKDVAKSMATLEEEDDDCYEGDECDGRKKMEVKAHQASHTKYLMMRGYCCPGIVKVRNLSTSDNIVVEPCMMRLQLRNTPAHNMFSSPPLDLTKTGPSLLPSILTYFISSSFSPPNVEECDKHLIEQRGYTPQDIEACALLRGILDEAGENGLDIHDLYKAYTHLKKPQSGCSRSLQQYMKDLQEEGQMIKVGSLGERWVLIQHSEPWLLTVNSKQRPQSHFKSDELPFLENQHNIPFMRKRCRRGVREETEEPPAKKLAVDRQESEDREDLDRSVGDNTTDTTTEDKLQKEDNVSFISRPWRLVDGKLNRQVCKGMLEAVLYHIMSRPGLTQQALVEHYKDVLQPMVVLDLVQALTDMGCVTKKTLVKCPKPSLFSRSVNQTRSETEVRIEEPDTVFYEPTISCCLRLGQLLPKERHWNYCVP
uniref:General transcription factor IIIC subunit 1 n=1 Tax=Anabas testudineus TaxID=64144 RepID=A0A7N6FIA8_ANATE